MAQNLEEIRTDVERILCRWSVPKRPIDLIMLLIEHSMLDLAAEQVSKTIADLRDQSKPEP